MSHTFKNCKPLHIAFQVSCSALFVVLGLNAALALPVDGERDGKLASPSPHPLTLTLIWYDTYRLLPYSFETMTEEVVRIFNDLGVAIRWEKGRMDGSDEESARDPLKLNVMLHPNSASGWGLKGDVMGVATHREGMKGSVYVFFPEVVRALGLDRHADSLDGPRAMHELARALGRVVAHEVVHLLVPDRPHTSKGLMKRRLCRRFLLQRTVYMDQESARMVREELLARRPGLTVASSIRSGAQSPDQLSWLERRARSWPRPPPR